MSYESVASEVVKVVEGVGGAIMAAGGLIAFARYGQQLTPTQAIRSGSCQRSSDA